MILIRYTLWLLAGSLTVPAMAEVPSAYQPCIACHGESGQGNPQLQAPALAGQGEDYLKRQLQLFQRGLRGADPEDTLGKQMVGMVVNLSEADFEEIAAFLSALSPVPVAPGVGNLMNGNNFYHAKCGACHGGRAQGNPALNAPALAWLDEAYLRRQFDNFQQGLRGTHPEDTYGRQMRMMSTILPTEQDLADVIVYIHTQGGAEQP
ncbi:MAG: c-type cytochrome [Pseudomonadota bacterium]